MPSGWTPRACCSRQAVATWARGTPGVLASRPRPSFAGTCWLPGSRASVRQPGAWRAPLRLKRLKRLQPPLQAWPSGRRPTPLSAAGRLRRRLRKSNSTRQHLRDTSPLVAGGLHAERRGQAASKQEWCDFREWQGSETAYDLPLAASVTPKRVADSRFPVHFKNSPAGRRSPHLNPTLSSICCTKAVLAPTLAMGTVSALNGPRLASAALGCTPATTGYSLLPSAK